MVKVSNARRAVVYPNGLNKVKPTSPTGKKKRLCFNGGMVWFTRYETNA